MNTLEHFAKVETDVLRKDSGEGTSHMLRGRRGTFHVEVGGQYQPVAGLRGPIRMFAPGSLKVNVFCMYALRKDDSGMLVDSKNFEFGDTFAVILEYNEFMKRVTTAAQRINQTLEWDLVEYIDETSYDGRVGPFKKGLAFTYQSEFRLALSPGTGAVLRFEVGDLSDLVKLGPLSKINKCIKFT